MLIRRSAKNRHKKVKSKGIKQGPDVPSTATVVLTKIIKLIGSKSQVKNKI